VVPPALIWIKFSFCRVQEAMERVGFRQGDKIAQDFNRVVEKRYPAAPLPRISRIMDLTMPPIFRKSLTFAAFWT